MRNKPSNNVNLSLSLSLSRANCYHLIGLTEKSQILNFTTTITHHTNHPTTTIDFNRRFAVSTPLRIRKMDLGFCV